MNKKNIVLTGGNSGIGFQTMKGLYQDGHFIIFGSRNQIKNQQAIQQIQKLYPNSTGKMISYKLNLAQRNSIDNFVQAIKKQMNNIDILINNAGLILTNFQKNQAGFEMTMIINHLGPFYLTYLLFQYIKKSQQARIINVSSSAHYYGEDDVVEKFKVDKFDSWNQYCNTKMANVLFTCALSQFTKKYQNIKVMSMHPGAVHTNFGRQSSIVKCLKCCFCCIFVKQQQGSRTSLHLCRIPFKDLLNGEFYDCDTRHKQMDVRARNKDYVMKLWKKSQEYFGIEFRI